MVWGKRNSTSFSVDLIGEFLWDDPVRRVGWIQVLEIGGTVQAGSLKGAREAARGRI